MSAKCCLSRRKSLKPLPAFTEKRFRCKVRKQPVCSVLRLKCRYRLCSTPAVRTESSSSATCCSHSNTSRNESRSEEHTSELQSHSDLVCRLLLEKKNQTPTHA